MRAWMFHEQIIIGSVKFGTSEVIMKKVIQHLTGKTAHVVIISGTHSPFKTWWKFGDYTNEIQYGILEFAGIKTTVSSYGPTSHAPQQQQEIWAHAIRLCGNRLCRNSTST